MRKKILRKEQKPERRRNNFFQPVEEEPFFGRTSAGFGGGQPIQSAALNKGPESEKETGAIIDVGGQPLNAQPPVSNVNTNVNEIEKEEMVQQKGNGSPQQSHSISIHNPIPKGGGYPMPGSTRSQMESSMGADFSSVRVHNDSTSHRATEELNAQAFTCGNDIYFNDGKFEPGTAKGKHLIAHELVHVIQQKGGKEKIQKQVNPAGGAPAGGTPAADIYYLDTNVFDQINRGNTAVATRLKALSASGAVLKVSPYIYQEIIRQPGDNTPVGEANRLLLREMNITVGPMPSMAYRTETAMMDKSKGGIVSTADLQLIISARLENAKIWSLEKAFRNNTKGIEKTFGVKIAPESYTISQLDPQPIRDYRMGRLLLNLPPITIQPGGAVVPISSSAPGNRFLMSPELDAAYFRYTKLSRVDEVFDKYGEFVNPSNKPVNIKNVKNDLGNDLRRYIEVSNSTGPNKANDQATLKAKLATEHPVETFLTPGYLADVEELNRLGPYLKTWSGEVAKAKKTGRISNAGIEALWEIDPKSAQYFVRNSGLSRSEQRRILSQLPGQAAPVGRRITAGFLIVVELVNIAAPIVQAERESSFDEEVRKPLKDIIWWQDKGISPAMEGVNDRTWPRGNLWSKDPEKIKSWLESNDLDYLSLTSLPQDEASWLRFTIWSSMNIKNYLDWETFIEKSTAVRSEGYEIGNKKWNYKVSQIKGTMTGHDVEVSWIFSPQLTTILNAAEKNMYEASKEQIAAIEKAPGQKFQSSYVRPGYISYDIYRGMSQAIGKKRFRKNLGERALYTLVRRRKFYGFPEDSEFYVFPSSDVKGYPEVEVPDDFIVVGGADYWTFQNIYSYDKLYYQPNRQVMLAKKNHLEDIPPVAK